MNNQTGRREVYRNRDRAFQHHLMDVCAQFIVEKLYDEHEIRISGRDARYSAIKNTFIQRAAKDLKSGLDNSYENLLYHLTEVRKR